MDIIKVLKENEKPFGLMSEGMQEKAKEIGKGGNFEAWFPDGWVKIVKDPAETGWHAHRAYRLRSDYQEKPEVVKCEVYISGGGCLRYRLKNLVNPILTEAIINPDFIGFLYEDGRFTTYPRMYKQGTSLYAEANDNVKDYEVLTPTHVLFRRTNNASTS